MAIRDSPLRDLFQFCRYFHDYSVSYRGKLIAPICHCGVCP
jgi:hypothetical protein